MDTREKIFNENRIQANRFAATMLLIIIVAALFTIATYIIGFRSEIVTTDYGSYLVGFSIIGFTAWAGTAGWIFVHKGEGKYIHYIIIADLLLAGIISSFLLRVELNWPMFVLCVIYTIRYSDPKFTVRTGIATSIAIVINQFLLIPYGIATGYLNMNFIEMSDDVTLYVKKGSFGIYRAIVENGQVDMAYVYREATIEILFPLIVYIAFIFVCYHITRYNRRRIYEQAVFEDKINAALEKANQANEAKTLFLSRMSHDIRTPMNAVIGYTELLSQSDDQEQNAKYLDNIRISSNQLMNLINNVLEMSRIESGRMILVEEVIDTVQFVREIGIMMNSAYDEKNIQITRNIDIKNKYCFTDKGKCNEIILNVMSNSIKYTPEGGHIELTVKDRDVDDKGMTNFYICIKDDGKGISKEFLPHIFDNFSREDDSNINAVTGTGLGMSIVKALVDVLHGTIEIESELGKGTTVTINLPARVAKDDEIKKANIIVNETYNLEGKKILLAEDNDLNAEIMIDLLGIEGVRVDRAKDGQECIEMISKSEDNYYNLILMDFQMPRMDGLEATKKIRELPDKSKSSITIVAMTANAFESDRQKALSCGMDAFISKPIDIEMLKRTLANVTSNK